MDGAKADPPVDLNAITDQINAAITQNEKPMLLQILNANCDFLPKLLDPHWTGCGFLHRTCILGHDQLALVLMNYGCDVNIATDEGTPLGLACKYGHLTIVEYLLQCPDIEINLNILSEKSPLYLSSFHGHVDIVNCILDHRPELSEDPDWCSRMLYVSCLGGHLATVQKWYSMAKQFKIRVDDPVTMVTSKENKECEHCTPLIAACSGGHSDVIDFLLQHGALVTAYVHDNYGEEIDEVLQRYVEEVRPRQKETGTSEENEVFYRFLWKRKGLLQLDPLWMTCYLDSICELNLSGNRLETLPDSIPWDLPNLKIFDVSNNRLAGFMNCDNKNRCMKLEDVNLSHNNLESVPLPLFQLVCLSNLDLGHNGLTSLHGTCDNTETGSSPELKWLCPNLKVLNLSHNSLTLLPKAIHGAEGLVRLNASHNKLEIFPSPWNCRLGSLDISHNSLETLPPSLDIYWSDSLETVDASYNMLDDIEHGICALKCLHSLKLSHNEIKYLPKAERWKCLNLEHLDLSHNKLTYQEDSEGSSQKTVKDKLKEIFTIKRSGQHSNISSSPNSPDGLRVTKGHTDLPAFFAECLCRLNLSNNQLTTVPPSVMNMVSLETLDLRGNEIHHLPMEIGLLQNCWQLKIDNQKITNLPTYLKPDEKASSSSRPLTRDILAYCRTKLRGSKPCYKMKLMMVGREERGKSCLLAALQDKPLPRHVSTNGIQMESNTWTMKHPQQKKNSPVIEFSTWDCAGQEDFYVTHQCFLSANALYLLVWNMVHHNNGIDNLREWLLNIEARAPSSSVIIVGTHLDEIEKSKRDEKLQQFRERIDTVYGVRGYPSIVGFVGVSCTSKEKEGIKLLKEKIYHAATNMKDAHNRKENVIGKLVPKSYLELKHIIEEQTRIQSSEKVPVLLQDDFSKLLEKIPDNDIKTSEDLKLAAEFLHEIGVLLHYPDQLRGLNSLYFIDPQWLCDMLAKIITIKAVNPKVKDGILYVTDLERILAGDPRFPSLLIPQYIQLLERFDIALKISSNELLLPSKLPKERPGLSLDTSSDHQKICRLYKMDYIPSGFWSRLITRLMVGVERKVAMRKPVMRSGGMRKPSSEQTKKELVSRNKSWNQSMRRTSDNSLKLHRKQEFYWREGFVVMYSGGYFEVESAYEEQVLGGEWKTGMGILITVQTRTHDFSAMGFVIDQIDAVIQDWFPGLLSSDLQRLIPCPVCWKKSDGLRRGSLLTNHLELSNCAKAAMLEQKVTCPLHPEKLDVKDLIPDLLMTDLPKKFFLDPTELKRGKKIARGGAGEVYRAVYKDLDVALKQYFSSQGASSGTGSSCDSGNGSGGATAGSIVAPATDTCISPSDDNTVTTASDRSSTGSTFSDPGIESISNGQMGAVNLQQLSTNGGRQWHEMLDGVKIVDACMELRREATLQSQLNHPFILSMVGVCLSPLCLVMELAPQGSLRHVLDNPGTIPDEIRGDKEMVFSQMYCYKVAMQIISALGYLHDMEIIYRDLKSDNILIWSLDLDDIINVKLSDYGISTFATPAGCVGIEGTPGFQAPEVRAGMVYDEKVDIFSFGMVIYEILSGKRPFDHLRSTSAIIKAVRNGEHPSLDDTLTTHWPCLYDLVLKCWSMNPMKRPTAREILDSMKQVQFLAEARVVPARKHDHLPPVDKTIVQDASSPYIWLWGQSEDGRVYHILNADNGHFRLKSQPCPGMKVTCVLKLHNTDIFWVGTENKEIDVISTPKVGFPSKTASRKTKDIPMVMIQQEYMANGKLVNFVYVGQQEGLLTVLKSDDQSSSEYKELKTLYVTAKEETGDVLPVMSLVTVNNGKELWVACGRYIAIVSTDTLLIEDRFEVYEKTSSRIVRHMVHKDDRVWIVDRKTSQIKEYDSVTHHLTCMFDCCGKDPTGTVVVMEMIKEDSDADEEEYIDVESEESEEESEISSIELSTEEKNPGGRTPQSKTLTKKTKEEKSSFQSYLSENQEKIEPGNSKADDFVSFLSKHNIKTPVTRTSSKTLPNLQTHKDEDNQASSSFAPKRRAATAYEPKFDMSEFKDDTRIRNRVTCVQVVHDTLWVGRLSGDILVINISSQTQYSYGQVLCRLEAAGVPKYKNGQINQIVSNSKNLVAVRHFIKKVSAKYVPSAMSDNQPDELTQLVVWKKYNSSEIAHLEKLWEDMKLAERSALK